MENFNARSFSIVTGKRGRVPAVNVKQSGVWYTLSRADFYALIGEREQGRETSVTDFPSCKALDMPEAVDLDMVTADDAKAMRRAIADASSHVDEERKRAQAERLIARANELYAGITAERTGYVR